MNFPTMTAAQAKALGFFCWDHIDSDMVEDDSTLVMVVETWARDCDMYERTSYTAIPATQEHLDKLRHSMEQDAEGPFRITLVPLDELEHCNESFRDRVLEAFEDGNGTSILI